MIRGSGIFGSVRESLEFGAAIERAGHKFIFYTSELDRPKWLPVSRYLEYRHTSLAATDELDALFFSDNFANIGDFHPSKCRQKVVCVMGFNPADADDAFGNKLYKDISPYRVIADGPWQLPILSGFFTTGPSMGGVNTDLFKPVVVPVTTDVVWSGDARERKGGVTVREAISGMHSDSYFGKGIRQEGMSAFLCSGKVFVDGHKRGGWCNPVMEAMSCGIPVVCTDTPCNSDFTEHGRNCLRVPEGDSAAMREAVMLLLRDEQMRAEMGRNGRATALNWTYDKSAKNIIDWLAAW